MATINPFTLIIVIIIVLMAAVITAGIIWYRLNSKSERELRHRIKSESAARSKDYWNELYNSNEGYEIKAPEGHKYYCVVKPKTKRRIVSINITDTEYNFWVRSDDSNEMTLEAYDLDSDTQITNISKNVPPYIVTEIIYDYDEEKSEITKITREHAYANSSLINNNSTSQPQKKSGKKKVQTDKNGDTSTKRPCEYHFQVIYVVNNKISILWFDRKRDAEEKIIHMVQEVTGNDAVNFGDELIGEQLSYKISKTNAYVNVAGCQHNWLVITLQ